MNYKKKIIALVLCISIMTGILPLNLTADAASSPAIYLQMVPCGQTASGKNFNGCSSMERCNDIAVNSVFCGVGFDKTPSAGDKITYIFIKYAKGLPADVDFTVSINKARVEMQNGKVLYLNELNGVYKKPTSGDIICDLNSSGIDANTFYKSVFKADITVSFGRISDYGTVSDNKFASDGKVTYDGNTITLDNVNYNGTLTLTGGKKYTDGIILLLKGHSTISGLNAKCPIKISSEGTASLVCSSITDTKGLISVSSNVTVSKSGKGKVFSGSPPTLKDFAVISFSGKDKSLPSNLYFSIKGNVITLEDFHFDGGIKLTGGGYKSVKLVLKGSNSIGELTLDCPVTIDRYCYADLTCGTYLANAAVTTDKNTSIKNSDNNTIIGFEIQSGHKYTELYSSEATGFTGSLPVNSSLATVTDLKGFTKGLTLENGSELSIDLTNKTGACSADEKISLSFYARAVSGSSGDAWCNARLCLQNNSNYMYGTEVFRGAGLNIPLTAKWQKFTYTGFWPAVSGSYPNIMLFLGNNTSGTRVEISGVELLAKGSLTASELDELSGMYDYAWRHKDAAWRSKAQQMLNSNRKGNLSFNITDAGGKPINGAKVTVKQTDYNYLFGAGCSSNGVLNTDGSLAAYFTSLKSFGINSIIDYTSILWENYYDDGAENTTYEFDRSDYSGDADFVTAAVKTAKQSGMDYTAQVLVYPGFSIMRSNSKYTKNYDELVAYVLSNEYTPEGFKQLIKDHVKKVITSYAGVIDNWCIVNEAYFSTDFFKLIYGSDGTGIRRETISTVTNGCSSNNDKITLLENWLNSKVEMVPASVAGKYIAEFSDSAQEAWVKAGCNPDELTLYYNDAATKFNDNRKGVYYSYATNIAKELAKPQNYKGGKVLVDKIGFQFADWRYDTISPEEIWSILDEYEAIGLPVWATEFNYWVDNPQTSNNSKYYDYGTSYTTSGCNSEAELQFIKDYTEAVMTAMYAHKNSEGIMATSYPAGQIGFYYAWDIFNNPTPLGLEFEELVRGKWFTPQQTGVVKNGKFSIPNAALGKYEITVTYGKITKTFNVNLAGKSGIYNLKLK